MSFLWLRLVGLLALGVVLACQPASRSTPEERAQPPLPAGVPDPEAEAFAGPLEQAHALATWRSRDAFRAHVVVKFGDDTVLDADLLMKTDMSRTRLELQNGTVALWDGRSAWVHPPKADLPMARFHVLTWPYFLSAPMKLRDPGTSLEPLGEKQLRGRTYAAAKLTFAPKTGDTPDDWYVVYKDPETDRLHAMAYIVTYGSSREKAEQEPHAITYDERLDVEGVPIPTRWTFWSWSEEEGIHGDPIGEATLDNPEFVTPAADAFSVPENAIQKSLPTS